ncbi:hypothetical protein [Candidatus Erwinia haradaeae]|uniref:hypothetical protein n=1 Tax=Candidatus Erwinia haradaeae TaxID=1922217 RepID=UPI00130036FE|nr:hypothetical protein [Candidatus Erwinia haradaeae]
MKGYKKALISILTFTLILSCSIFVIVGTTVGAQLVLYTAKQYIPSLDIQKIDGTLNHLTLMNLFYTVSDTTVEVKKVHIALRVSNLIEGKVCLNELMP